MGDVEYNLNSLVWMLCKTCAFHKPLCYSQWNTLNINCLTIFLNLTLKSTILNLMAAKVDLLIAN